MVGLVVLVLLELASLPLQSVCSIVPCCRHLRVFMTSWHKTRSFRLQASKNAYGPCTGRSCQTSHTHCQGLGPSVQICCCHELAGGSSVGGLPWDMCSLQDLAHRQRSLRMMSCTMVDPAKKCCKTHDRMATGMLPGTRFRSWLYRVLYLQCHDSQVSE